jgi:hypothetical protein
MATMPPLIMKPAMIVPSLAGRVSAELKPFARRGACSAKPLVHPRSPSDETTSQSTKPASGQVAGYPGERGVRFVAARVSR